VALIHIRPRAYHEYSPLQLAFGQEPNIFHLRIFDCAIYVSIALSQHIKMGPQRRLGIYARYESPSIIRYLEFKIGNIFMAQFVDCYFNQAIFSALGGEKQQLKKKIIWSKPSLLYLDPHTK